MSAQDPHVARGCYLDCLDYPECPCGTYDSEATGPLAGTGAGRTARKADTGAGFHPATRPNAFALSWGVILEAAAALEAAAWLAWVRA